MRHLGVPSAFTTGRPGLVMSAVKAVYQKICCAIWPWAGTGPDSPKVMPMASLGAYFFIQSTFLGSAEAGGGEFGGPPRAPDAPPGVPFAAAPPMPHSSIG